MGKSYSPMLTRRNQYSSNSSIIAAQATEITMHVSSKGTKDMACADFSGLSMLALDSWCSEVPS